jgi:hypothetical protein
VKPFALDENYRIGHDGRLSFTLERRQRNKETGEWTDHWKTEGWFGDLSYVCREWARRVTLESDGELPQALSEARAGLEVALREIAKHDFDVTRKDGPLAANGDDRAPQIATEG